MARAINRGGGRTSLIDGKVQQFKSIAWDLIIKRVTCKNEEEREAWIDKYSTMFANRMMPQEIEGGGPQVIIINVPKDKYATVITRELDSLKRGAISPDPDSGSQPVGELRGGSGREVSSELVSRNALPSPTESV